MQCCIIIFAACPGPDHFLQSIVQSPGVIQGFGQGWHIGGILPITDMPILICHNRYIADSIGRYPSLYKYPHRYPPICNRLPILHIGRYISAVMLTDTGISVLPIWAESADISYRPIPICQPWFWGHGKVFPIYSQPSFIQTLGTFTFTCGKFLPPI